MDLLSEYDAEIISAVDQWLSDIEAYSLRSERMPEGALPWLYEAAKIGAAAVIEDKVEGLLSDLDAAIEVAWNRGAHDWVRLNYPKHYERFTCGG